MLLLDLLGVLLVGLALCLISHMLDLLSPVFRYCAQLFRRNPSPRQRRMQIKHDLDGLLNQYRTGLLDERDYLDQADELIDQLTDVMPSKESLTNTY